MITRLVPLADADRSLEVVIDPQDEIWAAKAKASELVHEIVIGYGGGPSSRFYAALAELDFRLPPRAP